MHSIPVLENRPDNDSDESFVTTTETYGSHGGYVEHGGQARVAVRSSRRVEVGIVVGMLVAAFGLRVFAGIHSGLEVDEPIYHYAAAYADLHGFPAVRAAAHQSTIPFLYHPPFFLWLLAGWFKLWGNTSYFTGKMLNILLSTGMLGLLYAFVCQHIGKRTALLTLFLVGSDVWLIFTNQAIYFEDSQMLFVILAMWAYCYATQAEAAQTRAYISRYLLAGLLLGWVLVYKQIGGYVVISVFLNLLMQRKHWLGHAMLLLAMLAVVAAYLVGMHLAFGALFDSATFTQVARTLWNRKSPGLSYGPSTALRVIIDRYWIFPMTILALIGGSALASLRFLQHMLGKRKEPYTVVLAWALGGVIFALSISLKSPHYMILWLIPLYTFMSKELAFWFTKAYSADTRRVVLTTVLLVALLVVNLWSLQMRFLHLPGDALVQSEAYINANVPANAQIVTQDFIGVDINPAYVNIAYIDTPAKLFQSGATYAAFYWSTTEPLPASLGNTNAYCTPLKTFTGFKDHVEVCKLNKTAPAAIATHKK